MGLGVKTTPPAHSRFQWPQGSVRSAPANADLLAPLIDEVGSAVGGDLVGPVPQAQIQLHRAAGEDDLGPLDGARGSHDRPVADPQRPAMTGVVGPDQHGGRLGGVQPALPRVMKPISSSSIPPAASTGSMATSEAVGHRWERAAIASTLWMVVSWAWRRAQNRRGGGASLRNTMAVASSAVAPTVSTRAARPWVYQSSRLAAALPSVWEAAVSWSRSPRRFAAAHRCTMPWWTSRSVTSQAGQVGTLASSPAAAASSKAAPLRTSAPGDRPGSAGSAWRHGRGHRRQKLAGCPPSSQRR